MSGFSNDARRLRRELEAYLERYPREAVLVRRFLNLLSAREPAFTREHLPGHFTASALVFDERISRILLTHHRKLDIWIQLGGHTDGEADLARAAEREASEESGLALVRLADPRIVDVDIHQIPPHGPEPAHEHYDVRYAFIADPSAPLVVSDESHDLAWVALDRLAAFSDEESLHRAVDKAARMLRR